MEQKEVHWLTGIIIIPLVTIWIYLVGLSYQAGYLNYYHIDGTFAEILPTYIMVGWGLIIGYSLGILLSLFLVFELISRWFFTSKNLKSFSKFLLTYFAMFLFVLIPHYHSLIPEDFAKAEYILLFLIFVSHCIQYIFWKNTFTENSLAFYLARNFGLLIIFLVVAGTSLHFSYNGGLASAKNIHIYQTFGKDPEYAVVFIGSKYLFAMPINENNLTLKDELNIINLDTLKDPLITKDFGTGTLKIAPSL